MFCLEVNKAVRVSFFKLCCLISKNSTDRIEQDIRSKVAQILVNRLSQQLPVPFAVLIFDSNFKFLLP